LGKPLYVAAESYKFARLYPLHQRDLPNHHPESFCFVDSTTNDQEGQKNELKPLQLEPSIKIISPSVDFTPAKFITLLFTDLGILTPSAVSEELIKLYQ
jgi:translation initiation factor eIF-2B subunit alpha